MSLRYCCNLLILQVKVCYIISDIDKAVFFENTALELRNIGIECSFILINCTNKTLHNFLIQNQFVVSTLEAGSLLKVRKQIFRCKKILKEQRITHVHCHLAHANWIGLWASKLACVKNRIFTRHSGAPLRLSWKEKIIDKVQNYLATKIVSISLNIDDLLASQGVDPNKRVLIHHGFDLARFACHDEEEVDRICSTYNPNIFSPVIGVIARRFEWKGIHYTIQAFSRLIKIHPNALLCLFGDPNSGDFANVLKAMLTELPSKNVQVVSFEKNVFDLYCLFDVYIHVPINPNCEAFGQTYVEALASKVPSVFTLSGVAREFIEDGKNALVVPFENSDAIYNAIIKLVESEELCLKIISKGYSDVLRLFSFSEYIQKLANLYK